MEGKAALWNSMESPPMEQVAGFAQYLENILVPVMFVDNGWFRNTSQGLEGLASLGWGHQQHFWCSDIHFD